MEGFGVFVFLFVVSNMQRQQQDSKRRVSRSRIVSATRDTGTSNSQKDLGWAAFPYKRAPILMYPNTFYIYRCGSRSPQELTNPTFFSEASVAEIYRVYDGPSKPLRPLYRCLLSHGNGTGNDEAIRLMDIRVLRHWFVEEMLQFVQNKTPLSSYIINQNRVESPLTPCATASVLSTLFVTGILSFPNQLRYINKFPNLKSFFAQPNKMNYYNFVAEYYFNSGFRASYLADDTKCAQLYKDVFGEVIDGYISPKLYSPWHAVVKEDGISSIVVENDKFHQEMVIFDPSKTIRVVATNPEGHVPPKTEYNGGGIRDGYRDSDQTTSKPKSKGKNKVLLNHHSAPDDLIEESFRKLNEETQSDAGYQEFVNYIRDQIRSRTSREEDCDHEPSRVFGGSKKLSKKTALKTNVLVEQLLATLNKKVTNKKRP